MTIELSRAGTGCVIALAGRLDCEACQRLDDAMRAELDAGARRLALDMSGVSHLGESGAFHLMRALKQARRRGSHLCIAQPSDAVREALAVSMLDQLIPIYESTAEALAGD